MHLYYNGYLFVILFSIRVKSYKFYQTTQKIPISQPKSAEFEYVSSKKEFNKLN